MSGNFKGYLCGIVAAVSYGTNPLGVLGLYAEGINVNSVLFYRYAIALFVLGTMLLVRRKSLRVGSKELSLLLVLGVLFSTSSITLYKSFNYMDAGVASTLLFVYPVLVAVLMAVCFREKITPMTVISVLLSMCGVGLLYRGDGNISLSTVGVLLVMASSLSYAIYIIVVNRAALRLSAMEQTFYVLIFGLMTVVSCSLFSDNGQIQLLTTPSMWFYAFVLALLPTVVSIIFINKAINAIGSTSAAIMGALEPLTAVMIGVTVFDEIFTTRLAIGIVMILLAVILIILGKSYSVKEIVLQFQNLFIGKNGQK